MNEEVKRMVREIRERANAVTSFTAQYRASLNLQLIPLEVRGKVYHIRPDRFRSEITINNNEIVTIRKGSKVQRYVPKRNEIWKYTLRELPSTESINFGVADLKDPFFAVDEAGLMYEGQVELGSVPTYRFSAAIRNWARQGLLDTRKGYSIRYKPRDFDVRIVLHVDPGTGLLLGMVGSDRTGKEIFKTSYSNIEVNVSLDESLFSMDESTAGYKVVDITETLMSSLNPDSADAPPCLN